MKKFSHRRAIVGTLKFLLAQSFAALAVFGLCMLSTANPLVTVILLAAIFGSAILLVVYVGSGQ
jgi:hypothetical protein